MFAVPTEKTGGCALNASEWISTSTSTAVGVAAIAEQQQPADALIRRWLKQRDPNFTSAEVEEHVQLVKRELAQL